MKTAILALFIIFMTSLPNVSMAQPDGFDDFEGDAQVPLDGGVSLLVAAGVAYGVKKLHDKRKAAAVEKQNKDSNQVV